MPKLPFVSNSLIFSLDDVSHTLIRPSWVVLARYVPSSLREIAHTSPALLPSNRSQNVSACKPGAKKEHERKHEPTTEPASFQAQSSPRLQSLTSPPKPALAAF